ncbi:MAG: hypothetical protein ACI9W2_004098, partial [Gammaproteobacteria bacterium]
HDVFHPDAIDYEKWQTARDRINVRPSGDSNK